MLKLAHRNNAMKVIKALADNDSMTIQQIAIAFGIPKKTVEDQIAFLLTEKMIHRSGEVKPKKGKAAATYSIGATPGEKEDAAIHAKQVRRRVPPSLKADDTVMNTVIARAREIQALTGDNHWACQIASMEVAA